jgi:ethanolamine utilization protein EutJ
MTGGDPHDREPRPAWELFEAVPGEPEAAEDDSPPGPILPEDQGRYLDALLAAERRPAAVAPGSLVRAGLDLGTASIVLVVLSADGSPLGLAREEAAFVRDGLVVDFGGARTVSARLRRKLELAMGASLSKAAIAVPPGTSERDAATHRHVAEAAGLEVDRVWDEPVAANLFLGVADGAIADLGGGTTGAAVIKGGRLMASFDEATGGHHLSLALAGRLGVPLERAEAIKRDPARRAEVAPVVAPVLEKMGRILLEGLSGHEVPALYLVGGSAAAPNAGQVIARATGLPTRVLRDPELITPVGVALGCRPFPARPPEGRRP